MSENKTPNFGLNKPGYDEYADIADLNENADIIDAELQKRVEKVIGKGLSTNDFSNAEKTKLEGVEAGANKYIHPVNHPASIITQDENNRFVTDADKTKWNAKLNSSDQAVDSARLGGQLPAYYATATKQFTSSVAANVWTGSSAPYTATVTVNGVPANAKAGVGLADSATAAEREAVRNAMITPGASATANQVVLIADGDKPGIALPIVVTVWG